MTDLPELFKKAAEKWPDKFDLWSDVFVALRVGDIRWIAEFKHLEDPTSFSCDAMDAIAKALNLYIFVDFEPWTGHYSSDVYEEVGGGPRFVRAAHAMGRYTNKRQATLAGLAAALKYALEK